MRLFLIFLAVPLIEIALFIQVGGLIGLGPTLAIVILTAILGTVLVRAQGMATLARLRGALEELSDPTDPLAHGAMILFAGALLLTPGFFTDTVGFLLLVPAIRTRLAAELRKRVVLVGRGMPRRGPAAGPQAAPRPSRDATVIDGEFEEVRPGAGTGAAPPPDAHRPGRGDPRGPSGWTRS